MEELKKLIREVPDFPKPGILFYDITTLLKDSAGLQALSDRFAERYAERTSGRRGGHRGQGIHLRSIAGHAPEDRVRTGFASPAKLPADTVEVSYDLEYGRDTLQVHRDAVEPGQRVLIVDDLLATGGTAAATCKLVEKLGGQVTGLAFVIELTFLNGRDKLPGYDVFSLLEYHG